MHEFSFESYGVRVTLECDDEIAFARAVAVIWKSLLGKVVEVEKSTAEHTFQILRLPSGLCLKLNGESLTEGGNQLVFFNYFDTWVRLVIAEHAKGFVFLHCGVIAIENRGILFPGDSFNGKTTLVAELVRLGATYYSDEYAVIDENGMVHPFARPLVMRDRTIPSIQTEISPNSLGGEIGTKPVPVVCVLFLKFQKNGRWDPKTLTAGEGLMKILPQAIPLRFNSEFTVSILKNMAKNATFYESKRGNIENCIHKVCDLIDKI